MTITATPRRVMDLTAAGLVEAGDIIVAWFDGALVEATQFLNVDRYADYVVWRTVVAVDDQGEHVHITFDDGQPVTLPADDDVVALTTLTA